jgi:hypothetical protein
MQFARSKAPHSFPIRTRHVQHGPSLVTSSSVTGWSSRGAPGSPPCRCFGSTRAAVGWSGGGMDWPTVVEQRLGHALVTAIGIGLQLGDALRSPAGPQAAQAANNHEPHHRRRAWPQGVDHIRAGQPGGPQRPACPSPIDRWKSWRASRHRIGVRAARPWPPPAHKVAQTMIRCWEQDGPRWTCRESTRTHRRQAHECDARPPGHAARSHGGPSPRVCSARRPHR